MSVDPGDLEDANWLTSDTHWQASLEESRELDQNLPVQQFAGKVLVAEDNRDTQLLMDRMLKKSGLSAVVVGNGKQALEKLKAESFDLVMLDIQMPVMGGDEAARLIREQFPDIPLVAFTANVMQHQMDNYIRCGFNNFLAKPINRTEFYRILGTYLSQKK